MSKESRYAFTVPYLLAHIWIPGYEPSKGSAEFVGGQCIDVDVKSKDCKKQGGNGYFWDDIDDDAEGVCRFNTQCLEKDGIEHDWIDGECVAPPESAKDCGKEDDYSWYVATGDELAEGGIGAKCHYKTHCQLEENVCNTFI